MHWRINCLILMACCGMIGCVRTTDVAADNVLRSQAFTAFDVGNNAKARHLIAQADRYYVPKAELWRRTLELRIALQEGSQQGELRRFLLAWSAQRSDWTLEDRIDAELTLAETLRDAYAADWLYDLDPKGWTPQQRTRYNLLRSNLQQHQPALRDDTVARWRLAVRELYDAGNCKAAATEAYRCAEVTRNTKAAIIAAKLFNELGDTAQKEAALTLAEQLTPTEAMLQEIGFIRTAPLGTKSTF